MNNGSHQPWRVLLTFFISAEAKQRLRDKAGIEVIQMDTDGLPTLEDMKPHFETGVEAIIVSSSLSITKAHVAAAAPHLRIVSSISTGYEHIDVEACNAAGVSVTNAPGVLAETVADTVIGLMFGAARRVPEAVASIENGTWRWGGAAANKHPRRPCGVDVFATCGHDIHSSTVGIVGLGAIGCALARRLVAFNCTLLYTGRRERPDVASAYDATYASLDTLLRRSDFVVVLCPLTGETRGMFDKTKFEMMKPTAVFVNAARGGLVKQDDLVEALQERRIFAAGLDVMTPEPIPADHALVRSPHCFLTPHFGSASLATRTAMCECAVDNVIAAQKGKPLLSEVML